MRNRDYYTGKGCFTLYGRDVYHRAMAARSLGAGAIDYLRGLVERR